MKLFLAIVASLLIVSAARGDTVRTLDGRTLEGHVKLDAGADALTMHQTVGSAVRVKLTDVLSASFRGGSLSPTTRPARTGGPEAIRGAWASRDIGKAPANGTKRTATKVTLASGSIASTGERDGPDAFSFFCRPVEGDAEITVRLADLTNDRASAGVMLRGGPEPDAPFVYLAVAGAPEANGQQTIAKTYVRSETGKRLEDVKRGPRLVAPAWLKLQRESDFVNLLVSGDGQTWTSVGQERVTMPDAALVGVVCAMTPEEAARLASQKGQKEAKDAKPAPAVAPPAVQATFDTLRLVETPTATGTGLRGEYFDSDDFSGPAKLTRVDPAIDMDWGANAPDPAVRADKFSARWRGTIRAPVSGKYRLFATADDRVGVFVNGARVIENNGSAEVSLKANRPVGIRVNYVENQGEAKVKLEWQSEKVPRQVVPSRYLNPPTDGADETDSDAGLRGEYFSDQNLKDLQQVRTDAEVNFNQDASPVDPTLNAFSVRWTGTVRTIDAGKYTFYTFSDDGVRLWVNDKQIIDNWKPNPGVEDAGSVQLPADSAVPIRMESYNTIGGWAARLMWEGPDIDKQVVPADRLATPGEALDTRILTRDGSELTGITIDSMDDVTVRLKRPDGAPVSMPTDRVARLSTRPLTATMLSKAPSGSGGVLLKTGDFFEGLVERIEGRKVTVNSLIFGQRSFDMRSEVAAVVLQDVRPDPADYVVKTTDGSTYMATGLAVESGRLAVTDRAAGKVLVTTDALRDLTYFGPRAVPLATVAVGGGPGDDVTVDGTPLGLPMTLQDFSPTHGYGLADGATATFALDGQYKSFLATAGVPSGLLPTAGVVFVALADGKEIFRSPAMTSVSDSLQVNLKVEKAKALTLKVESADGVGRLPGVWADPLLTKP